MSQVREMRFQMVCTVARFRAVLLNLFDDAAHFLLRLSFWGHFTKNLFQNSLLGVITALSRNISRPTGWEALL